MADEPKNLAQTKRLYDLKDTHLVRKRKECPKCGTGVYMAEHADRKACGRCGYTEFNSA
jgi:small subunit ribosomal protein S27Ae